MEIPLITPLVNPSDRRIDRLALASGLLATALLLIGAALSAQPLWLIAPALASGLLAISRQSSRAWPLSLWFALQLLAAAGIKRPLALLLPAVLLSLACWDLSDFAARLSRAPQVFDRSTMERRHLGYLAGAVLLGGGLALLAMLGQLQLNFAPAVLLVLVVLIGLNWLLRRGDAGSAT